MAIIAIFGALYCHGKEVAEKVAARLGYHLVDEEVLELAASNSSIPIEKFVRAMRGGSPLFARSVQQRNLCIAHIKAAMAELAERDNVVCHGLPGHLLPRDVGHIVRIRLSAEWDYRIARAIEGRRITRRSARKMLKKDDEEQKNWTGQLFHLEPWDERLYDFMIEMHTTTVERAEKLICERGRQDLTSLMPESQKVMADFAFATKVNAALAEKGCYVEVFSDDGSIMILATQLAAEKRLRRGRIKELVERVPGVTSCEIFPEDEPSVSKKPSGVLLVDDEVEFVQTLSERLQMRDLNTAVAYDGREALTRIQSSEPAVMVLDLRMPRIDGVDVLRKVKKDNPNLEVIILTGHGTEKDRELTLELGAFAFLEKPVEAEILVKTIREAYEKIAREKAERSLRND